MADKDSVAMLIDSTTSKIQQLQQAFSELESHNAFLLNLKWKQLEEHFRGLEKSLKTRFVELEAQEREFETKLTESQQLIEEREAVVLAKELASLDRLQQKRDAAFSEILGKRKACNANLEPNLNTRVTKSKVEESSISKNDEKGVIESKPCTELEILCRDMNVEGLHKYISDNRKNLTVIREEIPNALRCVQDPCGLVLDSLKDFYSGDNLVLDGKKDGNLLGMRRTCLMLMESLEQVRNTEKSRDEFGSKSVIKRAKGIALGWKPKLDLMDMDASNGNSLEAHAFLQLVATFDIVSEFGEEELCKLVPAVSRRRQTPELCRSLGLSPKMPGVIDVLVNTGRQIDAVNLSYAFGLTEQYAPVPLLKSYLKEVRKLSNTRSGSMTPGAQNEMEERELSALKAVIKCIEEHKLEDQYPIDPLQKRVAQLEKAKADKRRAVEASKPQSKRARANGSIYTTRVTPPYSEKSFYQRATPERYPYPYVYPVETHHPTTVIGAAPYTISPPHTAYYANGYQVHYQPAPYIH
ncbi:FRIGIDA-like protein [Rhynchospora pubera]|uniref:FRIGIDA-like protein n=1 Tax=Rhynchospora pubera TaxID=906938 RepID=A0AAV8CQ14_9POAL|nr:FRIGIDA-like protein [Rhynchospora pubera]